MLNWFAYSGQPLCALLNFRSPLLQLFEEQNDQNNLADKHQYAAYIIKIFQKCVRNTGHSQHHAECTAAKGQAERRAYAVKYYRRLIFCTRFAVFTRPFFGYYNCYPAYERQCQPEFHQPEQLPDRSGEVTYGIYKQYISLNVKVQQTYQRKKYDLCRAKDYNYTTLIFHIDLALSVKIGMLHFFLHYITRAGICQYVCTKKFAKTCIKITFLLPDVLDKLPRRALFAPPVISTKRSSMFVISTKRKRAEKSINKAQSLSHTPLPLRATAPFTQGSLYCGIDFSMHRRG